MTVSVSQITAARRPVERRKSPGLVIWLALFGMLIAGFGKSIERKWLLPSTLVSAPISRSWLYYCTGSWDGFF
jgi:hypothetical protein